MAAYPRQRLDRADAVIGGVSAPLPTLARLRTGADRVRVDHARLPKQPSGRSSHTRMAMVTVK